MKNAAEAQREEIFQRIAEEEARRRAEKEYIENLRNDLQLQEIEMRARAQEQEEADKKIRQKQELQAAKEYQVRLR
jgi:hypothetical protein